MYNGDAYDDSNGFDCEMKITEITTNLQRKLVVPKNKVKFTYNLKIPKDVNIIVPVDYNLLRYI